MSKTIKRYNETTGVWEPLITPDVSMTQVFESGDSITDTNIVVTNENYSSSDLDNPNTLDDTLSTISDDISKLQRNVSWLAKHGGGGSGGGGGVLVPYGIEATYRNDEGLFPIEKGQAIYSEGNQVVISFTITGGTPNEICNYSYRYLNTVYSGETEVDKEVTFTVTFDKSATVIISATNPVGSTISPFNFTVYRSALSIKFDAATAGGNYDAGSGIYRLSMNSVNGTIPILITNGLGSGSVVTYTLKWAEQTKDFSENCDTDIEHKSSAVDLWQLPGVSKEPNFEYQITVSAKARLGNVETPSSKFQVRVRIVDPNKLTLAMTVNGLSDMTMPIDVELDTSMNITFKAYGPNDVSSIYYAGKLEKPNGEVIKIFGKYYDDTLKDEGSLITDNDRWQKGVTKSLTYSITESEYAINDEVVLYIKAWGGQSQNYSAETSQRVRAIPMSDFYPRQYDKRYSTSVDKDIMFASWNSTNAYSTEKYKWTSNVLRYSPIMYNVENLNVRIDGEVINANGYSGIESNPARMRLQNNAYMKITIPSEYRNELTAFNAGVYDTLIGYDGYVISITMLTDETPLTDRVAFLWGSNMADGVSISKGIKITNTKIYWAISDNTKLECNISSGEKHTIDFVYDKEKLLAKIYINGVLNQAKKVSGELYSYNYDIFVGANEHNGTITNTCDMSLYELSIYTNLLSDTQLVINGKNAKLETRGPSDVEDYNQWKRKNFLYEIAGIPHSRFEQDSFNLEYIRGEIALNSDIPTMALSFPNTTSEGLMGFTENYFYDPADGAETLPLFETEAAYYFDNVTRIPIENVQWKVQLQGTSTLKYRVKNLEIYTNDTDTNRDGEPVPVLFQPREDWFPEERFTLKADVVDSAHANNTVIGQWINNSSTCPILESTPPMRQLANNPVQDIDENFNQMMDEFNRPSYNTDVKIKHTTEGFPILLFLSFAGRSDYIFAGIYSFNLGRYSFYNLGLKFLKSFKRFNESVNDTQCPRMIRKYEESRTLGTLNADNVYSYEFDNLGSDTDAEHPVWSQYGTALLPAYGEFKYGNVTDQIRQSLSSLMEVVAKSPIKYTTIFNGIHNHVLSNTGAVISRDPDEISQDGLYYQLLKSQLNLNNAAAYFVIANAFGMTDSIGKNMTLRTWDGTLWYTCFYDMDTALGLDNTGRENIPTNAAIDYIYYSFEQGVQQGIKTIYHADIIDVDSDGQQVPPGTEGATRLYDPSYAAYKSKLWAVLRETDFLKQNADFTGNADVLGSPYIERWATLRNSSLSLSKPENFSNMVKERVAMCGEIIYDRDYDSKYIQDTNEETTLYLHGTRVEYIKKWLRDHIYFLDGLFDINDLSNPTFAGIEDSPYYKDMLNFKAFNKFSSNVFNLTISSTVPSFFRIGVSNGLSKYYVEEPGKEYVFPIEAATNSSTQMELYGSSLLTKIDGLNNVFEGLSPSQEDCLKALLSFNASQTSLGQSAFSGFKGYLDVDSGGQLEGINISNARFKQGGTNETLDLGGLTKVLRIDISNTNLSSLILPDSSLDSLNVVNSSIGTLRLNGQNKLQGISIDGCSQLTDFQVSDCGRITGITASTKENLSNITLNNNESLNVVRISQCPVLTNVAIFSNPNLDEIIIENCEKLLSLNIYGNKALRKITINGCTLQNNLSISIKDAPLEEIVFDAVTCINPITLPSRELLAGVEKLTMRNCYSFNGIIYDGDAQREMYDGKYVFDISPMLALNGRNLSISNVRLEYVRVRNDENNPLKVYSTTFDRCVTLIKVFGHIEIEENVFGGIPTFYVNHDVNFVPTRYPEGMDIEVIRGGQWSEMFNQSTYLYDGVYPPFNTVDPYYTNVSIGTGVTSLSGWFHDTNCDIHDAYYILQLCNPKIRSLESTFSGCKVIEVGEEEWLDINMFAKCINVANINHIFQGCNINCVILPEPFTPLIANLTEFVDVFAGDYMAPDIGSCFFPEGNNLVKIVGFNPKVFNSQYFGDDSLLSTLTKLVEIDNSFNRCGIDFARETFDATELFKHNVSLKKISNSFRRLDGSGTLRNIFGGDSDNPNEYPRLLEEVSNSFTFEMGSHVVPFYPGDEDQDKITLPLGNSLFKSVPRLKFLTGPSPGSNRTNADYGIWDQDTDSFCGNGLMKYLDNITIDIPEYNNYHRESDCNSDGFPHEILHGLTQLEEMTALFSGAKNFLNASEEDGTVTVPEIRIPLLEYNGQSMFKDCGKLKNISKMFRDLDPSIVCELTGKAFKKCCLVNVDNAFEHVHIRGGIPFGMFYQATTETWDDSTEYEKENPTIIQMASTFYRIADYVGLSPYTAKAEDLVMDNPDFSTSAPAGSKNSFKKIWNLYAYDGTDAAFVAKMNIARNLYSGQLYTGEDPFAEYIAHVTDNWSSVDPQSDRFSSYVGHQFEAGSDAAYKFAASNYFCPPDIFKYCVNTGSTNISYALGRASGDYSNGTMYGLYGRIPEMIFYPLNGLSAFSNVFNGNRLMFPYSWMHTSNGEIVDGIEYPSNLFSGATVTRIDGLFASTRIWPNTKMPSNLFDPIQTTLIYAQHLWNAAYWAQEYHEGDESQIPNDMFMNCSVISDVSGMLGDSYQHSIAVITTAIFTPGANPKVSRCSGFMKFATSTHGSVPEFWTFNSLPPLNENGDALGAYLGLTTEYIGNYSTIESLYGGNVDRNPYLRVQ